MGLLDKFKEANKKAQIKAFLSGEESKEKAIKAAKIEKKGKAEDAEKARQLRKESEELRRKQQEALQFVTNTGLGEKILKCYFTYKMASLACNTLVGLCGGHSNNYGYAATHGGGFGFGFQGDTMSQEEIAAEQAFINAEKASEARAAMIEQTLESFERMSEEGQKQGIIQEPLLTDEDRTKLHELAEISRDTNNAEQAEQYAAKCAEMGLDYNEALTAFNQDKTFSTLENDIISENQQIIQAHAATVTPPEPEPEINLDELPDLSIEIPPDFEL